MGDRLRIGYVGVGLMGHGCAKNILEKGGHALTIMGHRNRQPVDDLVARGAREVASPAEVAEGAEMVFLCLPSSNEVEDLVYRPGGLLESLAPGAVLVDQTTADPTVTRRIGADLEKRGCFMVDAPMGRTPKEAEAGTLSTYVGGPPEVVARVEPVLACFADTIVRTGALGTGTTCKLVNNFIAIGTCAVIAEALACAAKLGVDLEKQAEVLSAGGANGRMWQMMQPWILEGDDSHLKGPMRIAGKDMRFYNQMAEAAPATAIIAQAVNQVYRLVNLQGHADRFMPVLPGILAGWNGAKIRDLE